jgi:ABC-2 type transport system permease protein
MKFEFILIFRQKLVLIAMLLSMSLAALALWNGQTKIDTIRQEIHSAIEAESTRFSKQINQYGHGGEAGETGYYVFHTVYNSPTTWSFISLGNRNFSPHIQRIRLLGLQAQLYDGESHNPEYAVAGNFDFAFVVIFILPLFCIALAHDLCSIERNQNRLTLLQSLAAKPYAFWAKRLFARWFVASASIILPLLICNAFLQLPWLDCLNIGLAVALYALFWVLLSGVLSFYLLNPSTNAILCLNIWLLITILIPSMANILINNATPVIAAAEIALDTRQKTHVAWDLPKPATFDVFFKAYPEWKDTPPVTTRFHYKWYYAFQHVADMSVREAVHQREQALLQRDAKSRALGNALPSVAMQYWLDDLAQNNLKNLFEYRNKITHFHTRLREYFYPYLFNELPFNASDFQNMPNFK